MLELPVSLGPNDDSLLKPGASEVLPVSPDACRSSQKERY